MPLKMALAGIFLNLLHWIFCKGRYYSFSFCR